MKQCSPFNVLHKLYLLVHSMHAQDMKYSTSKKVHYRIDRTSDALVLECSIFNDDKDI